jgi:catechol 2,3-dioxygenase
VVWSLLEPWFTSSDGVLVRSAVYEFRSMLADQLRRGRVMLVGDSAHLTPPFLGQGLCAGLRDVLNLAWKLDLVIRGVADEALMDTLDAERQPQNEAVIGLALGLGQVLCQLDPQAAEERDAMLRQAGPSPPLELAPLTGGVIHRSVEAPDEMAGTLSVQGLVAGPGGEGRFDDVVGGGFALIVSRGDPLTELDPESLALIDTLAITVASLDPSAPAGVRDLDGRLTTWLDQHAAHAVLVRPDFYVFGSARAADEIPGLLADLSARLHHFNTHIDQEQPSMSDASAVIHPEFHHFNLKTTRLEEMIDFYCELVGAEVIHQDAVGAWLSNDQANHRIALLAFPNFTDDPEKETRTGMHHSAFEYSSFEDLNASYLRLKEAGISPALCLDHGMTLSYYYADPDGNHVELQVDCFGDWSKSADWMRSSPEFKANPIGHFVDPEQIAADHAAGVGFAEIHAKAMGGGYAVEAPVEIPEMAP